MDTRKIYYIYKNVKRDIEKIDSRIEQSRFETLLLNGQYRGDLQATSLYKESEISDFIDEWEVNGFTGEYAQNLDGSFFIRGDILVVREVKCPDDMTLAKFNTLSVGEMDQLIYNHPECEISANLVCSSNIPVSIDALAEIEFKPAFNNLRLIAKNNTDIHTFFDFYNYKEKIKDEVKNICNGVSSSYLEENKDVYVYTIACEMANKIHEHFNFNNKPFIITEEIKDIYKKYLQEDIEKFFDEHINIKLEQNIEKGGKHR